MIKLRTNKLPLTRCNNQLTIHKTQFDLKSENYCESEKIIKARKEYKEALSQPPTGKIFYGRWTPMPLPVIQNNGRQ